jgi:antitoxin MazE
MSIVKSKVVRIGNSKGIRIPKAILEQCDLHDEIELETRDNCLIVRSSHSSREGWDAAFQKMSKSKDDNLLVKEEVSKEWDEKEWQW